MREKEIYEIKRERKIAKREREREREIGQGGRPMT